jgi:hypothetical protein
MLAEPIDQLKQKYTDKYVVVDGQRPELARFRDVVGRVKTVNMSGRALVEFDDYHLNIGWYDIDPSFLKVVDKPAPKPKEAPAKKPAAPAAKKETVAATGEKKLSPLEMARAQGAAGKGGATAAKPAGGKPSTADILAAARAGKAAAAAPAAPAPAAAKPSAPATPAAAPAKVDRSKMSVAEMLAAARAGGAVGSGGATSAPAQATPAAEAKAAAKPAPAPAAAAAPAPKASSSERVDKSKMTVDDMIAWCRAHDTK